MGVKDLWKLLAAAGRQLDLESLRGKRVAIDVSIWMIRIIHGMSNAGVNMNNVHLVGIMKRIILLLQLGVKPIFVFDGTPPDLKRETLILRAQQRQAYNMNLQKIAEKYVVRLLEKGVDTVPEEESDDFLIEDFQEVDEVPQDEQEIIDEQEHRILNLQFESMQGQLPEFYSLNLREKQSYIELLLDSKEGSNLFSLKQYVLQAQQKERIKEIRRIAKRQIENLRIAKFIDQYDDKESRLIKEYLRNNEDLLLKMGQFGIDNVYLYLKDPDRRKQLAQLLFSNYRQKKRKLKDFQIEDEHLKKIRQHIRNRYQQRYQEEEQEQEVKSQHEQTNIQELYDDELDLDKIRIRLLQSEEQLSSIIKEPETLSFESDDDDKKISEQVEEENSKSSSHSKLIPDNEIEQVQNTMNVNDREIDLSSSQSESSNSFDFEAQIQNEIRNEQYSLDQKQLDEFQAPQNQQIKVNQQLENDQQLQFSTGFKVDKQVDKQEIQDFDKIDKLLDKLDDLQDMSNDEMLEQIRQRDSRIDLDIGSMQNRFEEIRYLLSLFGIPWVMAPGEAEAQCAYLQEQGLVDCVVTDDSDAFLFGATRVIKGLFHQSSGFQYYDSSLISQDLGLNRNQLIYMALFLGSDYTPGIKGVGIVNAMEIVEVFDSIPALRRFAEWASKADILLHDIDAHYENIPEKERIYKEAHKNYKKSWQLPDNFPSERVIQGYIDPQVDQSLEPFTWAPPAVDKIVQFARQVLLYSEDRIVDSITAPLDSIKKETQTRITDYFSVSGKIALINSRRINSVITSLNNPSDPSRTNIQSASRRKNLQTIKKQPKPLKRPDDDDLGDIDLEEYKFKKSLPIPDSQRK